mmetsp:Transcript_1414/g.4224  ORF Transcript_1414/g.4224 Transcript_1414/m.4224 type:complete len:277 (+) Transcript_1414:904-1734(+)
MPVAAAHDGGVPRVQVLHLTGQRHDVAHAGDDDAARHRRAHKLVATHTDAAYGLLERHHGCTLHEGDHEAEQRSVAVDVETILTVPSLGQDCQHPIQVIDCPPHRGADVDINDGGAVHVGGQLLLQFLVVYLPARHRAHLDGVHAVHACCLHHRVVRLFRGVQDPVRQIFAAYEDTVQVAFRAAVSDVAPVLVVLNLPQLGEPIQHPDLELAGMHAIVRLDEGVSQVVDAELGQTLQGSVIEVQIVGIPHVVLSALSELNAVGLEHLLHLLVELLR